MLAPLDEKKLTQTIRAADTGRFGSVFEYHPSIGSTNDRLRILAERGAPEGMLVIADEQVAGRGQRGRVWIAPPNTALLMSVLFRPQTLAPAWAARLAMVVGLAAIEAMPEVPIKMKWPNDLRINGRKVAGILPESAVMGDKLAHIVVGLGLNVNQIISPREPLHGGAISLRMAQGKGAAPLDRMALVCRILEGVQRWYALLESDSLREAWQSHCETLGQRVRVERQGGVLTGRAIDIDAAGALRIHGDDGMMHLVAFGEASIITANA